MASTAKLGKKSVGKMRIREYNNRENGRFVSPKFYGSPLVPGSCSTRAVAYPGIRVSHSSGCLRFSSATAVAYPGIRVSHSSLGDVRGGVFVMGFFRVGV